MRLLTPPLLNLGNASLSEQGHQLRRMMGWSGAPWEEIGWDRVDEMGWDWTQCFARGEVNMGSYGAARDTRGR